MDKILLLLVFGGWLAVIVLVIFDYLHAHFNQTFINEQPKD